jgi:hypothetical protein
MSPKYGPLAMEALDPAFWTEDEWRRWFWLEMRIPDFDYTYARRCYVLRAIWR